jgi:hypothetical protein
LAGPAAVESGWMSASVSAEARRAAVNDDADAAPVRFAPGGDAKQLSERISHWALGDVLNP